MSEEAEEEEEANLAAMLSSGVLSPLSLSLSLLFASASETQNASCIC